jgi:hypothetical protein
VGVSVLVGVSVAVSVAVGVGVGGTGARAERWATKISQLLFVSPAIRLEAP